MITFRPELHLKNASIAAGSTPNYETAEQQFIELLTLENLDRQVTDRSSLVQEFETVLEKALEAAYANLDALAEAENRFLHRVLYRINRLNFVW